MASNLSGRQRREAREKKLALQQRFVHRITLVKQGKQNLDAGLYGDALKKFRDYAKIIADVKEVEDIYHIKPQHFDPKMDLTEMIMLSHVYFEMARIYDSIPKFLEDSRKCLNQFVAFSANQPYQVVNSEMLRKYLKKATFKNEENFRKAYEKIYVESKKCYVVTFCFGDHHPVTDKFRQFKDVLLETRSGQELVRIYYSLSSRIVSRLEGRPAAHLLSSVFIKPILLLFSKTLLRLIIK